eukprot:6387827-Pyramimonas_sp.AAC.2
MDVALTTTCSCQPLVASCTPHAPGSPRNTRGQIIPVANISANRAKGGCVRKSKLMVRLLSQRGHDIFMSAVFER